MNFLYRSALVLLMLISSASFAVADEYDETRTLFENAGICLLYTSDAADDVSTV